MHGVAIGPSKRNAAWSTVPRLLLSGGQPGCETTVTAPTQMAAKIGGVVRPAVMRADDTCKLHSVPACVADIHSVLYSPQSPLFVSRAREGKTFYRRGKRSERTYGLILPRKRRFNDGNNDSTTTNDVHSTTNDALTWGIPDALLRSDPRNDVLSRAFGIKHGASSTVWAPAMSSRPSLFPTQPRTTFLSRFSGDCCTDALGATSEQTHKDQDASPPSQVQPDPRERESGL